jgi:3'(2'), 5'-bisphosphate nucleotidase
MQEESDLDFAIELAELVMDVLDEFKKNNPVPKDLINRKEYGKSADKYSHDFLMKEFAKYRPNDVVLSEEGLDPKERLKAQRCWIIDPLDGTFYFANNRKDYAIHIALWEKESKDLSNISIAVVGIPETKKIYTSNDNLHIPKSNKIPRLLVSGSRPPMEMPKLIEFFDTNYGGLEVKSVGSVGAKVVEILEGNADFYVHTTGFYEWDIAAPLAVADKAGLIVSDISGNPLELNKENLRVENVIVSKKELFKDVLQAIS